MLPIEMSQRSLLPIDGRADTDNFISRMPPPPALSPNATLKEPVVLLKSAALPIAAC